MARAALAVQDIVLTGVAPAYSAGDAGGHQVAAGGTDVFLHVKNANASACTVTITATAKVGGLAVSNLAVVVPANTGDRMIGPLRADLFGQADGTIYADLSITASVTLAALRLKG